MRGCKPLAEKSQLPASGCGGRLLVCLSEGWDSCFCVAGSAPRQGQGPAEPLGGVRWKSEEGRVLPSEMVGVGPLQGVAVAGTEALCPNVLLSFEPLRKYF